MNIAIIIRKLIEEAIILTRFFFSYALMLSNKSNNNIGCFELNPYTKEKDIESRKI